MRYSPMRDQNKIFGAALVDTLTLLWSLLHSYPKFIIILAIASTIFTWGVYLLEIYVHNAALGIPESKEAYWSFGNDGCHCHDCSVSRAINQLRKAES